jgi:hypothetical protein
MAAHIRKCPLVPQSVRQLVDRDAERDKENTNPSPSRTASVVSIGNLAVTEGSPLKRAKTNHNVLMDGSFRTQAQSASLQREFGEDMCKLFVACGFLWNSANNPEMHKFVSRWMPGMVVPDRRLLSGRILKGETKKQRDEVISKVRGKIATGQCDGWENIAKTHIVTSMMTVENEVSKIHLITGGRIFTLICAVSHI